MKNKRTSRLAGLRERRTQTQRNDFSFWVDSEKAALRQPLTVAEIEDFVNWVAGREEESTFEYEQWRSNGCPTEHPLFGIPGKAIMLNPGLPIRVFYANLLAHGLKLRVANGQLRVGGNVKSLSPIYRDEIVKRAEHLIELLEPEVPANLEPFFYRLLKVDELKEAIRVAEVMGISLRQTPVNHGWLIEIMNMRVKKATP